MDTSATIALALVAGLCVAHFLPPHLHIRLTPRSWILSAAAGVSVAYVFVHLLPEIAAAQDAVEDATSTPAIDRHSYLVALFGLAVFYGLERLARQAKSKGEASTGGRATSTGAFWVSIGSFAIYNAVIGYLVFVRAEEQPLSEVVIFVVALGLHFLINDLGLREHHQARYDRIGRPLLVAAVLAGWAAGLVVDLPEVAIGLAVAFLGGGIIFNVMKEELPEERESRFLAFACGAAVYTALLLAT